MKTTSLFNAIDCCDTYLGTMIVPKVSRKACADKMLSTWQDRKPQCPFRARESKPQCLAKALRWQTAKTFASHV